MLASHHRMIAKVIGGGVGNIAGGKDVLLTDDFQVGVHMQTTEGIAFTWDLLGQRTGLHTSGSIPSTPGVRAPFDERVTRHRGHAPLASIIDLPRFTYLDSSMLRRLPIALFTLACRKLTEGSSPICDGFCCLGVPLTYQNPFGRQHLLKMSTRLSRVYLTHKKAPALAGGNGYDLEANRLELSPLVEREMTTPAASAASCGIHWQSTESLPRFCSAHR